MKEIDIDDLKRLMIKEYYKRDGNDVDFSRELVIKEINDNHGRPSSVFFSVMGSPPKGIAVLARNEFEDNDWVGDLFIIGQVTCKKIFNIKIINKCKEDKSKNGFTENRRIVEKES